jgi:ribose transport system substrate-binding protein
MKKISLILVIAVVSIGMLVTFSLSGCKGAVEEAVTEAVEEAVEEVEEAVEEVEEAEEVAEEVVEEDMDEVDPKIVELRQGMDAWRTENVQFKGPGGQTPTWDTELLLTKGEVAEIQAGNYKAALARHGSQGEYTEAMYGGCLDYLEYLGFEITADASAEFDDAALISNIETIMATKPDVMIGFPQNTITAAEIFKPAVDAGTKLVFVSNQPDGYVHGEDFVGISTSQPYDQGVYMADAIEEATENKKIGVIFFDVDFYIVNLIDEVVIDEMGKRGIEIVAEQGFADVTTGIQDAAAALIQQNPEIDTLYVSFNALYAATACEDASRPDINIISQGLDIPYMINMLSGGNIYSIITDSTYNIGVNLAIIAGYGVLGKESPEYVVTPSAIINEDNVEEMWNFAFRIVPLPDDIKDLL